MEDLLFYVMPYVEGGNLEDRLKRVRQLPVDDAIRTTVAVAQALDYAHRHGIVHRDIKPANSLLHDGQPVIADFGIALAVSASGADRLTATGMSLGTPLYMSPSARETTTLFADTAFERRDVRRQYDVTPDGKRFIMIRSLSSRHESH